MDRKPSTMEEPRLDEFFRDKLEDFSSPAYDPTAWERLAPRMSPLAAGASFAFWHWLSGLLGALLLLSWAYILSNPSGERQIVEQLDSLQQQLSYLNSKQTQIQKDTVYVYLQNDSTLNINSNTYTSNPRQSTLTQAQNVTAKRSANSSPPQKRPQSNGISNPLKQSASAQTSHAKTPAAGQNPLSSIADLASQTDADSIGEFSSSIPSENATTDLPKSKNLEAQPDAETQTEASPSNITDSVDVVLKASTLTQAEEDSLLKLAELNPTNIPDSSVSVRLQPKTKPKNERSYLLQNWISAREVRAGLQIAGGSLLADNTGSGFQSVGGLYLESNFNDDWWLRTGLDVGYRIYEGENEDDNLPQDLLDALPGLVDPVTAADLKEFYMKGYSLAVPLALRREIYLNRDWDLGLQASVAAHRYLLQDFEYESITEEEIEYQSRGSEQKWTLSPLRLSVMAIHNDRFRPSIGLYTEYDLMARGVEPIRFWSVGMQASFGLQLK